LEFAIQKATPEGKATMSALLVLSLFSWTIIITKARQLAIARKWARKFFAAYESTRDPLEIKRKGDSFEGAPAYHLYVRGADELEYHLKNYPVQVKARADHTSDPTLGTATPRFLFVRARPESAWLPSRRSRWSWRRAAAAEAMALEKGMIVLSTAVAGGPFIGLLGTVWGVMETFAGIANAGSASLTAMAPGVAGALICTVIGLLVAIPAMFSYNFMVTTIRAITQELDGFASRFANQMEHRYVDNRPLSEEIKEANEMLAARIVSALQANGAPSTEMNQSGGAMKKCSHSAHHSLTELNITPLLDLAFVLLVIFIITTTPIVNDLDLNLPAASKHQKDPPRKAELHHRPGRWKTVDQQGGGERAGLQEKLVELRIDDPDLSVVVRGDSKTKYSQIRAVLDSCQQANVAKVDLATEAADQK
jgi:biopolymer transport protein TolQ